MCPCGGRLIATVLVRSLLTGLSYKPAAPIWECGGCGAVTSRSEK